MPYEMKITAIDATDFAQKLAGLAALFGGKAPAPQQPFVPTGDAQSEEAPKRRGRPAKTEPAPEPVQETASEQEQQADIEEAIEASKAAEKAAKQAASEPAKTDEKLTVESVRKFVVEQYLHAHFVGQEAQRVAFRALLDEFSIDKLSALTADKLAPFKARVDALIAEKAAAK